MSAAWKITTLIAILIAGILFASSTSMPVANTQPTPTSLTLAVPSPPQGKPFSSECTLEATLTDENENPLQGFDIDFYACGTDCMDWIATVKTDSQGVATLTYTFSSAATYNVTAMFSGTTHYASSSSEYVDIILIDYTPYLVGGGILVVIVGYIVFLRRRMRAARGRKLDRDMRYY